MERTIIISIHTISTTSTTTAVITRDTDVIVSDVSEATVKVTVPVVATTVVTSHSVQAGGQGKW